MSCIKCDGILNVAAS